ncbi:MAG TPA: hypothetical protein VGD59_07420 [Acidisarcina sp.]
MSPTHRGVRDEWGTRRWIGHPAPRALEGAFILSGREFLKCLGVEERMLRISPTHRGVRDEWGTRHPAECAMNGAPGDGWGTRRRLGISPTLARG